MSTLTQTKLTRIIANAVKSEVQTALAPLQKQNTTWMNQVNAPAVQQYDNNGRPEKGVRIAQVFRSLAFAKCDQGEAMRFAEKEYGANSYALKALSASDFVGGGATLAQELSSELIELLRPRSIVRAAGPMIVNPTIGSMAFPRITAGATAAYTEENEDIVISEQTFGQVVLVAKKLAALVPMSNDLLKFGVNADEIVRDDLINAIVTEEDQNLLRGNGLSGAPKGLLNQAAAANIVASAGVTAANIETDFRVLMNSLTNNDVAMIRPVYMMAPRSKNFLFTLRDANGNLIFQPQLANANPTIYGIPVLTSTNIPINLGGGSDETEVYLADMSEVIFGEVTQVDVAVSGDATYLEGANLRSAFSRDQTLMRVTLRHDLAVKHDVAIAVINAITWGA